MARPESVIVWEILALLALGVLAQDAVTEIAARPSAHAETAGLPGFSPFWRRA